MARVADKVRGYDWAAKGPLKESSFKANRAWRFQTWLNTSPYARAAKPASFRAAWSKYQDEMARIDITSLERVGGQ